MRTFALLLLAMVATCAALKCNTYYTVSGQFRSTFACPAGTNTSCLATCSGMYDVCMNYGYVNTYSLGSLSSSTGFSYGGCSANSCGLQKNISNSIIAANDWSCTTCATDGCNAVVVSGSAREASVTFAVAVLAFAALKIQ